MYAKKTEFVDEVRRILPTILGKNAWAKKYFELEMPATGIFNDEVSANRCWNLYEASRDNALGFLLLGEVSMRSKFALVQNFGLTSAHGHEDEEPWLSPWLGTPAKNPADAKFATIDPSTLDAKKNAHLVKLQGPGSILSDRLWTPLMNDAWLLGGVHKEQSFHLVTEGLGEPKLTADMDALKGQDLFQRRSEKFGDKTGRAKADAKFQTAWQGWFNDNPQYLYETWGPRVLVRELIGLMTFGYAPQFTRHELSFHCKTAGLATGATVTQYSDALNTLQFHQGADLAAKAGILRALSTWMFGRDDALP